MQTKTLLTLVKVRKAASDLALHDLATHQQALAAASDAVREAENRIAVEMAAATDMSADDAMVATFAAWLPRGRAAVADARRRLQHCEAEVELAQARLSSAKSDLAAAETLLEQRQAEEKAASAKRAREEMLEQVVRKVIMRKQEAKDAEAAARAAPQTP